MELIVFKSSIDEMLQDIQSMSMLSDSTDFEHRQKSLLLAIYGKF